MLGMPRGLASQLAKLLQLGERHIVSREVQQAVKQHRTVTRGQHKAVPIGPGGLGRIVLQKARPEHIRHRRGPHGHPRMAGVGFLDAINGKKADGVDAKLVELRRTETGIRGYRSSLTFQAISPPGA